MHLTRWFKSIYKNEWRKIYSPFFLSKRPMYLHVGAAPNAAKEIRYIINSFCDVIKPSIKSYFCVFSVFRTNKQWCFRTAVPSWFLQTIYTRQKGRYIFMAFKNEATKQILQNISQKRESVSKARIASSDTRVDHYKQHILRHWLFVMIK